MGLRAGSRVLDVAAGAAMDVVNRRLAAFLQDLPVAVPA